jgi:prepilin-type N-terminal cleavage/methylation domain-containing protein
MAKKRNSRGFTLIEVIIVMAIGALLSTVVFFAVDPVKIFKGVHDSRRRAEVRSLVQAIRNQEISQTIRLGGDQTSGSEAPVIASDHLAQVIVQDASGIDCAVPTSAPLCPQLPAGYSLSTAPGRACVTRLDRSIASPTAPTATAVSGEGLEIGTYRYKVTYVTAHGETDAGDEVVVTTSEFSP